MTAAAIAQRMRIGVLAVLCAAASAVMAQVPAPPLRATTVEGQPVSLAQLRGKVVLVNFWATTCAICLAEQPELVQTFRRYQPRGLEVIAVAMPYDRPDLMKRHLSKYPMPFKVVWDREGQIVSQFGGVLGTPTTFVVDREGRLISRTTGAIAFDKLERLLDKSLP